MKKPEDPIREAELALARHRCESNAPTTAQLSDQAWYSVCKFYPKIAARAHEFSHRPIAEVGPDNPLDKTSSPGTLGFFLKRGRQREPGEEG